MMIDDDDGDDDDDDDDDDADDDDDDDDDEEEEEEEDMVGLCRFNPCEHTTDRTREESIPQNPPTLPLKSGTDVLHYGRDSQCVFFYSRRARSNNQYSLEPRHNQTP